MILTKEKAKQLWEQCPFLNYVSGLDSDIPSDISVDGLEVLIKVLLDEDHPSKKPIDPGRPDRYGASKNLVSLFMLAHPDMKEPIKALKCFIPKSKYAPETATLPEELGVLSNFRVYLCPEIEPMPGESLADRTVYALYGYITYHEIPGVILNEQQTRAHVLKRIEEYRPTALRCTWPEEPKLHCGCKKDKTYDSQDTNT
jgi:hypothetical protein